MTLLNIVDHRHCHWHHHLWLQDATFRPSRPGCTRCLFVTDYSFNVILRLDLPAWGATVSADGNQVPANTESMSMYGTKQDFVPKGFPMFVDGPVGHTSQVEVSSSCAIIICKIT